MVYFRSEFLFPARVLRFGISTTNIAGDDVRSFAQFFQCPHKIANVEPAAFPIGHGFSCANTIEVDRNVELCSAETGGKVLEFPSPIFTQNCAATLSIFYRSIIRPRVHFKFARAFRAAIAENLVRPPAFKIAATPDAHALHMRKFERAINPTSATPFRRPNVPVGMVIEGDEDDGLGKRTQPKGGQIMKVARAIKQEWRRQIRLMFSIELFDQTGRRGETQLRPPTPRIGNRNPD